MQKNRLFSTKALVTSSLLTALSIVLTRFISVQVTDTLRISIGNLPIMISGILFGPVVGALTGFVADFVGTTFFSPYAWFAPLGITPILIGFLPAFIRLVFLKGKDLTMSKLFAMLIPTYLLGPLVWSTISLHWLYGRSLITMLYTRVPYSFLIVVIEISAVCVLAKSGAFKPFGLYISGGKKDELRRNASVHTQR